MNSLNATSQIYNLNQPSGRNPVGGLCRRTPTTCWRSESEFNTEEQWRVRLGAYLWSRVSFNNTLKHKCVSFFDGVDPLADVIIIDVTRCAWVHNLGIGRSCGWAETHKNEERRHSRYLATPLEQEKKPRLLPVLVRWCQDLWLNVARVWVLVTDVGLFWKWEIFCKNYVEKQFTGVGRSVCSKQDMWWQQPRNCSTPGTRWIYWHFSSASMDLWYIVVP